jgi:hypothetical protein
MKLESIAYTVQAINTTLDGTNTIVLTKQAVKDVDWTNRHTTWWTPSIPATADPRSLLWSRLTIEVRDLELAKQFGLGQTLYLKLESGR